MADRVLVLDDVKLLDDGQLAPDTDDLDRMFGRQGNILLLNGRSQPAVTVAAGAQAESAVAPVSFGGWPSSGETPEDPLQPINPNVITAAPARSRNGPVKQTGIAAAPQSLYPGSRDFLIVSGCGRRSCSWGASAQ
jgi:hypothetical protein